MTDNVVSLVDPLREIRRQAATLVSRRQDFDMARAEFGGMADTFRRWQLMVATADATRTPRPEPDPEMERTGVIAVDRLERASEAHTVAYGMLAEAIGQAVADQILREGDEIVTPQSRVPLTVAQVRYPTEGTADELALGEVTLTADGLRIVHERHNVRLEDGRPVDEPVVRVRFERWWQRGVRVGGYVHPISRRIMETD